MNTKEIRLQARRYSRVDTNGIPDSHVNDLLNDAIKQFAKDIHGFPAEDYLDVTPIFDTRKSFALRFTITGGTNALAVVDVSVTGTDRTDVAGTQVATDLQATLRTAIGGGANATVTWSTTTWKFTIDTIDGTRIQIDPPTGITYIDASMLILGESGIDETEAEASYTGQIPEGCCGAVALPSDICKVTYVEWDKNPLVEVAGDMMFSPQLAGIPLWYYVRGKVLRISPTPTYRELLHVAYKNYPAAITSFDTGLPAIVTSEVYKGLVYWMASEMLLEEFDKDRAATYYGKYWRERNKYVIDYSNQQTEMRTRRPEPLFYRVDTTVIP